ncbi:hypothetical protein ACSBR2_039657 [Camellia fascicularis]
MFTINGSASWLCDQYGHLSYPKTMSWNETTTDCCSWDGIKCDRMTGQVIALDLSCSQLCGTILPNNSLFSLRHLQRLNLAFNDFTQSRISPSFGQLSSLTHLNLSSSFSGSIPSEISHLSKLVSLDLFSYYQLVKLEPYNFHVLLQNLTQLQYLCLARVNISSTVLISLMNLSSLTYLDLEQTGLQEKLSNKTFHLPNLEALNLGYNPYLTGYLPQVNWTSSGSLSMLRLTGTAFSGGLPDSIGYLNFSGQVSSIFSNPEQLFYLDISYNRLEGQIPNIANLSKVAYFTLRRNHFIGQFPCWVANLTQLVCLNIGLNELTGPIPTNLRGFSNFRYLCSAYNSNTRTLPIWLYNLPSLKYLSLASIEFTGPHSTISDNHNLFLSMNTFTGEIPSTICNVSFLEILDFSHNSLSGVIPLCLANFSNVLSVLDLRMNNFHGNIPSTFTEGKKLRNIDLNGNQLEGRVPRSLATCRHLEVLDIGNNKINDTFPHWLEFLPELQVLVFKSNKFHGPVDSSVDSSPHGVVGGWRLSLQVKKREVGSWLFGNH